MCTVLCTGVFTVYPDKIVLLLLTEAIVAFYTSCFSLQLHADVTLSLTEITDFKYCVIIGVLPETGKVNS